MHGALIHITPALYNVLLSTSPSPECHFSAWTRVSFHCLWFTFSYGPERHSSPIQMLSTWSQHWPITTDSFSLSWFYPDEYAILQTSERGAFSTRLLVSLPPLSPTPHPRLLHFFLSFEYKYISHLNGDEEKWCKLAALDWVSKQQERGVRGASGRRWVGKIAQAATYSFAFPSTAKWTRTRCVFCAQFIQGNQHLHYTYNMQINANLLVQNKSGPPCVCI